MDDRKCNLDFDFTPIGQAIKKALKCYNKVVTEVANKI